LFKTNSTEINMDDVNILAEHALYLLDNPSANLLIDGHADNRGNTELNQTLSKKRAQTVYDMLISMGAAENQLSINAFGDTSPIVDVNNWQANRRVELNYSSSTILSKR